MLDNNKLNRRVKRILRDLKEKWGITLYRIAVESKIPHSSLKYMIDGKFEWKLNHLLSIIDFLDRNNYKVSLQSLLDFENKLSISKILNSENADFGKVIYGGKRGRKSFVKSADGSNTAIPYTKNKRTNFQADADSLIADVSDIIKESDVFKISKIDFNIKISSKNIDYKNSLNFKNGKEAKK